MHHLVSAFLQFHISAETKSSFQSPHYMNTPKYVNIKPVIVFILANSVVSIISRKVKVQRYSSLFVF